MKAIQAIALLPLAIGGCSANAAPELNSSVGSTVVVITGAQRTYSSVFPVELKAMYGDKPSLQVSVQGSSGTESWSLVAWPALDQATTGNLTANVVGLGIGDGLGTLTQRLPDGSVNTQFSGKMTVSVSPGRVAGEVATLPASGNASFSGVLTVSCWVPVSVLGAAATAGGSITPTGIGAPEPLVEDTALATASCGWLRSLRAK